jgi:hypothetical protein
VLDIVLDNAFSVWIVSIIFILYDGNRSKNRNVSNKADELIAIPCCIVLMNKGLGFLAGAQVLRKCQNILHIGENLCSQKNGPNNLIRNQSAPHMNLKNHASIVRGSS